MPLRILLDEHISPSVAHQLSALGFDVVCARDRGLANRRIKDWQLMAWCIEHQHAICTKNGPDFDRVHRQYRDRSQDHPGILIVDDVHPDEIYWALRQYLESDPDPALLVNHVVEVPKASPDFVKERSGD